MNDNCVYFYRECYIDDFAGLSWTSWHFGEGAVWVAVSTPSKDFFIALFPLVWSFEYRYIRELNKNNVRHHCHLFSPLVHMLLPQSTIPALIAFSRRGKLVQNV